MSLCFIASLLNILLAGGGASYMAFSKVSIVSSKFIYNTAENGGALLAHNGSLHIVESTFINNHAHCDGGVIYSSRSSFTIISSMFISNGVACDGGVMKISGSSFNVSSSTFTNNSAARDSGVMEIADSSL